MKESPCSWLILLSNNTVEEVVLYPPDIPNPRICFSHEGRTIWVDNFLQVDGYFLAIDLQIMEKMQEKGNHLAW